MKIRVTKNLLDIPERYRPRVGYVFDVLDIKCGLYKPCENNLKMIECCGHIIAVSPSECEIVKKRDKR